VGSFLFYRCLKFAYPFAVIKRIADGTHSGLIRNETPLYHDPLPVNELDHLGYSPLQADEVKSFC
jgi:hypothetical protein